MAVRELSFGEGATDEEEAERWGEVEEEGVGCVVAAEERGALWRGFEDREVVAPF